MNFKQRAAEIVSKVREKGMCIDDLEVLIQEELSKAYAEGTDGGWAAIQDSMPQEPCKCLFCEVAK
jgi:hypothetical protein